jgi:hypothetical protein
MAQKPAFIRWSREREARVQSRMLDVLERRFRRRMAAVILAESDDLTAKYREIGFVPPPDDAHFRAVRDVYLDLATASARTFGVRIVTQGKAAGHVLEVKEEGGFAAFFRSLANAWINLEPVRRRITSVTETTRNRIVGAVARGQEDGLGVDAIARQIQEDAREISRQRGALIARTETHGAANFAMNETAKTTGLDLVKEWVAVEDARTRSISRDDAFDHVAMDGQQRSMDEPFDMPWVGGAGEPLKIMYPGEAGKPGGAVINCRCSVVHTVAD